VVAWPNEERVAGLGARRSPLYDKLCAKGAVYGGKFGWERPNWFRRDGVAVVNEKFFSRDDWQAGSRFEHQAIRTVAALIDQSSFAKFLVTGAQAFAGLQHMAAADLDKAPGAAIHTQLLNERGGIEADVTIMRLAEDQFYVVTGSGFGTRDGGWIRDHLPDDGSATLTDVTSGRAVLNLCGPNSRDVLARVTGSDLGNAAFPCMTAQEIFIGYAPVLAIRLTYVGELGWELHIPTEYAAYVYEKLWEAGAECGLIDAGYHAIDSLRLEKRYLYWGADISPDTTPLETGLDFAVGWHKSGFIGRDALLRQKETGATWRLVCLALDRPLSVYGSEAVLQGGKVVGITTSGDYAPTIGKSLVLGYVPADLAIRDDGFAVEAFGERSLASRIKGCAYDPKRQRILL
jgi:4-methylaminobutanoate oxidase (formaldehyde-forming)